MKIIIKLNFILFYFILMKSFALIKFEKNIKITNTKIINTIN